MRFFMIVKRRRGEEEGGKVGKIGLYIAQTSIMIKCCWWKVLIKVEKGRTVTRSFKWLLTGGGIGTRRAKEFQVKQCFISFTQTTKSNKNVIPCAMEFSYVGFSSLPALFCI